MKGGRERRLKRGKKRSLALAKNGKKGKVTEMEVNNRNDNFSQTSDSVKAIGSCVFVPKGN